MTANISALYGTWYHVLVTLTSTPIITHYINGVVSGTPGDPGTDIFDITTTNAIRIGNIIGGTTKTFDGSISQVKMWNKVLSSAEIAKVYRGNPVTDGLILDVPLKDDYNDKSDTGLTGTNSGSYLSAVDDQVASDVSDARVTANDIIKVFPLNNKIMNVNIEEA